MHDYLPTCTPLVSALDKPVLQTWLHDFRFGGISILWIPFIELGVRLSSLSFHFTPLHRLFVDIYPIDIYLPIDI